MRKALQASLSVSLKVIPDRVMLTMGLEVLQTSWNFTKAL
jgi:hypothetical protein